MESKMLAHLFKNYRELHGFSQATLAQKSKVSLAMIQLIEANEANPSFEILEKLGKPLGLQIEIMPEQLFIEKLAQHFQLITHPASELDVILNKSLLKKWLEQSAIEIPTLTEERLKDTFSAILLAIREYFPSFENEICKESKQIKTAFSQLEITGRLIKLKRLALPPLLKAVYS